MRHINLLDAPQKVRSPYTTAVHMGLPILLVLAVMGGQALYARAQLANAQRELDMVEAEIRPVREQLSQMQAGMGAEQANAALREQITRASAQLQSRQKIQSALQRGELGSTQGFSGVLESLARQTVPGAWLTGIRLEQGGQAFVLTGRTLNAEAVASMVLALHNESSFKGRSVGRLELSPLREPDEGASGPRALVYSFRIASTGVLDDEQPAPGATPDEGIGASVREAMEGLLK